MLCFRKICRAKKLLNKRVGEYKDFPSIILFLTVPKEIVPEPFVFHKVSGIEKFCV